MSEQTNAFTAGISPGGLTNDFEIRVYLCFLMEQIARPISFSRLGELVGMNNVVNYFEYVQAVSTLKESGHFLVAQGESGEEEYELSQMGRNTAAVFEKSVPLTIRQQAIETVKQYFEQIRLRKENLVEIQKVTDGYTITLIVGDTGTDLMKLMLFSPTRQQCEQIQERFLQNPAKIYKNIMGLLTET